MQSFNIEVATVSGPAHLIVRPLQKNDEQLYELWNEENHLFTLRYDHETVSFSATKEFEEKALDEELINSIADEILKSL